MLYTLLVTAAAPIAEAAAASPVVDWLDTASKVGPGVLAIALLGWFLWKGLPKKDAKHAEQNTQQRTDFLDALKRVEDRSAKLGDEFMSALTDERKSREAATKESTASQLHTVTTMIRLQTAVEENTAAVLRATGDHATVRAVPKAVDGSS